MCRLLGCRKSAGLAMSRRLAAPRAVLLELETIRRGATVLAGDVIPLLALDTGERDLGADIRRLRSHFHLLQFAGAVAPVVVRSGGGA